MIHNASLNCPHSADWRTTAAAVGRLVELGQSAQQGLTGPDLYRGIAGASLAVTRPQYLGPLVSLMAITTVQAAVFGPGEDLGLPVEFIDAVVELGPAAGSIVPARRDTAALADALNSGNLENLDVPELADPVAARHLAETIVSTIATPADGFAGGHVLMAATAASTAAIAFRAGRHATLATELATAYQRLLYGLADLELLPAPADVKPAADALTTDLRGMFDRSTAPDVLSEAVTFMASSIAGWHANCHGVSSVDWTADHDVDRYGPVGEAVATIVNEYLDPDVDGSTWAATVTNAATDTQSSAHLIGALAMFATKISNGESISRWRAKQAGQ